MALFRGLGFSPREELHSRLLFPRRAAGSRTAELAHCALLCPAVPAVPAARHDEAHGAERGRHAAPTQTAPCPGRCPAGTRARSAARWLSEDLWFGRGDVGRKRPLKMEQTL